MAVVVRSLFARKSNGTSTVTVDLGAPKFFLAWGIVTVVDSISDFDSDNAVVIDIPFVGQDAGPGVRQPVELFGGAHFGSSGALSNVYPGAVRRFGRTVTFRLRAFHSDDLECFGYGIVIADGDIIP